jgi:hypothetical protein
MESPFDRPPINVGASLADGQVPNWEKDYLATVSATTGEKARLLDSLRTGEDPTIRDGVNLALSRLVDPNAPQDPLGKTAFLVHDGTGTGKSFQAILAAKAIALETGEPALITTRADLLPALRRDLDRLGLDESQIAFVPIEQLGAFLKDAPKQKQQFSVAIVDEAQDCRIPEVRKFLDRIPARRQLFFSATPFHNIDEFCYFSSKLTGKPVHQIKNQLNSAQDLHLAVADQLKQIISAGGMVHREFPFFGNVPPAELLPLSAASRDAETQLIDGYARLVENRDLPQQRKLKEDLVTELNTASDATKIDSILQRTLELLSQNKKVMVAGDDLPVASRILKESDGLPKETPGFLSALRLAMAAQGIECSIIRAFPPNSDAIPALSGERAVIAARNFEEMARFVDGAYRTNETGQRLEVRGRDHKPIYSPSQTKVILIPYQQVAGWPELNQRFPQAPEVSMVLTPTANADQFIQAIGRGSRRNSQGPTDVHLVANESDADRRRLSQLLKGLQFIAATGSPAIAPFLQLAADCLNRATTQRAAQGQRLIQLQRNQQAGRNAPGETYRRIGVSADRRSGRNVSA